MLYNTSPEFYIGIRQILTVRSCCVFYASRNANAPIGAFENNDFAETCLKRAGFTPHPSDRGYDWVPPKHKLKEPLMEVLLTPKQRQILINEHLAAKRSHEN